MLQRAPYFILMGIWYASAEKDLNLRNYIIRYDSSIIMKKRNT